VALTATNGNPGLARKLGPDQNNPPPGAVESKTTRMPSCRGALSLLELE